jgi:hypothetical protein
MNPLFRDPLFNEFAWRALYTGDASFGEVFTTAGRIPDGDRDAWYQEWVATANRVRGYGDASARAGHTVSAREAYARASTYYRTSYFPLYGAPVDPRLVDAFDQETACFEQAAALMRPPIEAVEIPFESTTLPGYFCRADESRMPRRTLIVTDGYDSTIQEMYTGIAVHALRRGYNVLLFDGPGQGRVLIKQGIHMRPDWENVVRLSTMR